MQLFFLFYGLNAHAFTVSNCNEESKCPIDATECTCDEKGQLERVYWEKSKNKLLLLQRWDIRDKESKLFKSNQIVYTRDGNGRLLEVHHENDNKKYIVKEIKNNIKRWVIYKG